jgi:RHS repeat-associated protein
MEYDEGLLSKVLVEKDDPDPAIPSTVTIDRNEDGSVTRVTRSADGVADRFQTFEYGDEERMFVTRTENALGHATTALTHPAFGVVVASRDPNNVLTTRQINDRGMVTRVQRAGSAAVAVAYADRASNGITVTATSSADASVSIAEYDLRGRPIESRRSGFDGTLIHTKSVYDELGRQIAWSLPGYGQPSTSEGHRTFDSLGRIVRVRPPGSLATTYEHTFLTTEITTPGDAASPETKTRITRDLDGRIASSEQYDAKAGEWLETKYLYGEFDLLSKIIDPQGNETTFDHDKLGRRTFSDEPDAGQTWLEYDGLGDLTKRIAGGSVTHYTERDVLGRLVEQVNGDGLTSFTWDTKPHGIGKLAHSVSPDNVAHDFTYDVYSRPKTESWTVDGAAYTFVHAYDLHGRLKARTYPTSAGGLQVKVRSHYNAFGFPDLVDGVDPLTQTTTPYWQTYAVAATGGITQGQFGSGVVAERGYDPQSGRLDWIKDAGVLFQSFTYDVAGRLASVQEASGRREEYTYDSLARLSTWTLFPKGAAGGDTRQTTFHYDPLGNLLSEDIDTAGEVETIVHSSGLSAFGPHTPAGAYTFDARGRLVNPNGQTTTYTEFDLPRQIGETHFRYDAEGTRVSKVGPAGTSLTLGGLYERRVDAQGTTDVYLVPGPEGVVAQISLNPSEPSGGHVTYLHGSRKGSVHVASTAAGVVERRLYYDPFGARTNLYGAPLTTTPGDVQIGFNGLDHDDELGLINQRGRVYNPSLRRFLTPDPIISNPLNGQTYNPYSYVRNDPVNRIDPSGYCDSTPCMEGSFDPGGSWTPVDHTGEDSPYYTPSTGPGIDQTAGRTFTIATTTQQAAPAPPVSIGINDQTATPVGSTSWQPSHRLHVWTGPFTAATGELEGIAEAAPTGFEWGCAKACQFVISGLALAENVPNIPDMFNSALEAAQRVKHGATAGDRAEAALTTAGYTASFVFTTSAVVAPLLELPVSGAASMNGTMENGATIRYSTTATAIGDDANTLQNFARSRGAAGHDLIVHGRMLEGEGVFWVNNMPTHPQQVADALLGNPAYRAGTPVQLVTCYGACGLAQELGAILGAPVKALPAPVELHPGTGLLKLSP